MFGSKILDIAIGLIFVYILMSVICASIREGIEAWLKTRAAYLEYGIRELLHDRQAKGLAKSFFNHPLIYGLFSGEYKADESAKPFGMIARGNNLPSYIPSKNFALALMDMAARGPDPDAVSNDPSATAISLDSLRSNISKLQNPRVERVLLTAIDSAEGNLDRVQANLEAWYDSAMDRVSGHYKRSTQWILLWIALAVTVGLNVNTITIVDYLHRNEAVRTAMVAKAEAAAKDPALPNRNYEEAKKDLDSINVPIGWAAGWGAPMRGSEPGAEKVWNRWFAPFLGWLLTALAATLGAPFWFDLLNKVMVIRSTVKPHEKSPEEASEDRQQPTVRTAETSNVGQGASGGTPSGSVVVVSPLPPGASAPNPMDNENAIDGCDVDIIDVTPDEDLPVAEGGIA